MLTLRFACNAVEPFDLFALPAWAQHQRELGRIEGSGPVTIEVAHPEREMDGSCRWCGCREDEVVLVDGGPVT